MSAIVSRRGGLAGAALLLAASCALVPAPPDAPAPPSPAVAAVALPATPIPAALVDTIAAIWADYAPDRRVARFEVEASWAGQLLVLAGSSDQPAAMARLAGALVAHDIAWEDRVRHLPALDEGEPDWALVTISVANLRSEPRHSAELATQAPLGTPLRVLDSEGGWLLVQVPDGYIAWVDVGGVERVAERGVAAHQAADKVVYLRPAGTAWSEPSPNAGAVSDLVLGALLVRLGEADGYYRVAFPDGREAYVATSEARRYAEWAAALRPSGPSLVATAMTLLGRPYLWGGTSAKGMDCSGFTKTVYFLNGLILPRDASQQVHAGTLVDEVGDFSQLTPGDLLFFGRARTETAPERVVHVGMWLGEGRFIHASGRVRISSVDPSDPLYDHYNTNRYLRSRRMVPDGRGVHPLTELYPVQGRFAPAATAGPAVRSAAR
jgi:gamma-D-glutamyl-L-lysine dipeptidyl-peptidase